jgi:hypothetical protein
MKTHPELTATITMVVMTAAVLFGSDALAVPVPLAPLKSGSSPPASAPAAPVPPSPAATVAGPAAPIADACPPQLTVRQSLVEDISGWTPQNQQASSPFVRVAFYPAAPADASLMIPTTEYRDRSGLHDTWDLPRRASGYTVSCRYGDTTATISRKLDDNVDFCLADYDGRYITLVVKHWTCGEKKLLAPRIGRSTKSKSGKAAYKHGS